MWKRRIGLSILFILAMMLTGCDSVQLTTGLRSSEFAKIGDATVKMDEVYLLLAEMKYSYESIFDTNVWEEPVEDITMEDYVKNQVRDSLLHITYLELMAEDMQIELTDTEIKNIKKAAEEYFSSIGKENQKSSYFTLETVEHFYTRLLLAEKTFYSATDQVDTEVSTDEARAIDVQYIFFGTLEKDEQGEVTSLSKSKIANQKKLAEKVLEQVKAGTDFMSLARKYSEDSQYFLELDWSTYDEAFTKAAFNLEMGEVSPVVSTDQGFYIIKCTNDNADNNYEERSESIVLKRRTLMFADSYGAFVKNIPTQFNDNFWKNTDMTKVPTGDGLLYDIYNQYFVSTR